MWVSSCAALAWCFVLAGDVNINAKGWHRTVVRMEFQTEAECRRDEAYWRSNPAGSSSRASTGQMVEIKPVSVNCQAPRF
jgi:hypothetical protein